MKIKRWKLVQLMMKNQKIQLIEWKFKKKTYKQLFNMMKNQRIKKKIYKVIFRVI